MNALPLPALTAGVPVDPDAQQARDWLIDELARAEYRAAQPTWFDRLSSAVFEWLQSLTVGAAGGPPGIGVLLVVIAVAVILIIAFLVFGLPRLNRRSAVTGDLFDQDDARDSAAIRRAAEAAAAGGDFTLAIAEIFRSTARGLAERTVLTPSPGTTAHDFAVRAGLSFPAYGTALEGAARAFDEVRYLGRSGSREQYDDMAALELSLRAARPVLAGVDA